jgi:hypothetical protein
MLPLAGLTQDTTQLIPDDTTRQVLPDSLRKKVVQGASLRSAAIPGWGQVYNKKYWKAPLALGAVGTGIYFSSRFAPDNRTYKEALILRLDGDSTTIDQFDGVMSTEQLIVKRRLAKTRLNAALFSTLFAYAMNITDAYADASIRFSKNDHHPEKAGFYSALLPGAGQLYNRKYWKIPIVYGALGVSIYFVKFNSDSTRFYADAHTLLSHGEPIPSRLAHYTDQDLIDFRDFYKNQLDISYIAVSAVYVLNIIDAIVDAHLFDFDISDDLSLSVWPSLDWGYHTGLSPGIAWKIRL